MPPPRIVALGEVLCRLSPAQGETLEHAQTLTLHVGGAEANVTAGLSRFGIDSALVSLLPGSPLGYRARGALALAGVRLEHLAIGPAEERLGLFFVERSTGVAPTAVWYDRSDSCFARNIAWPPGALAGARFAVLSGITPAISARSRLACEQMVNEAIAAGVEVCLDVNYRARMWSPDAARAALLPLLARASVVVCSERDARALFDLDAADPLRLRERVATAARICVITRGERGATGHETGVGHVEVGTTPAHGGDRIGIGDAFMAGLLCGLAEDRALAESLGLATRAAALKAGTLGDMSLARRADLDTVHDPAAGSVVLR